MGYNHGGGEQVTPYNRILHGGVGGLTPSGWGELRSQRFFFFIFVCLHFYCLPAHVKHAYIHACKIVFWHVRLFRCIFRVPVLVSASMLICTISALGGGGAPQDWISKGVCAALRIRTCRGEGGLRISSSGGRAG